MELAKIPASLKQACAKAQELPDRALYSDEMARLWAKDRAELGDCGRRHGALVEAVGAIEGQGR
ncbi:hypothetical protein [Pararhizobium arenae]|uniref:hypothetical protein n=1 Tax=Pararhizobium arenae TaxID=1856850 RepID=UPI00094B3A15|nr:hypothetical protein [Pararhizobium arenae]